MQRTRTQQTGYTGSMAGLAAQVLLDRVDYVMYAARCTLPVRSRQETRVSPVEYSCWYYVCITLGLCLVGVLRARCESLIIYSGK